MHLNNAFAIAYFINIYLLVNNIAFDLTYGHRKRELDFNNYPASNVANNNPMDNNNNNQQNQINDPGYTKQHENDDLKKLLNDKNINSTNAQNWLDLLNTSGQMFHVIYMLPNPQKRELNTLQAQGDNAARQPIQSVDENLSYAGPHLFPTQFNGNHQQNGLQLNIPFKNFNNALQSNTLMAPQHYQNLIKDSKVATKMEAPFIPSQFLGYDQNQRQQHMPPQQQPQFVQHNQQLQQHHQQQMPTQRQHLPVQNPLMPQQGQLLPHPNQLLVPLNPILLPQQQLQALKTAPVYEHHEDLPFHSPNLIYMSPNNLYNLYRKPN